MRRGAHGTPAPAHESNETMRPLLARTPSRHIGRVRRAHQSTEANLAPAPSDLPRWTADSPSLRWRLRLCRCRASSARDERATYTHPGPRCITCFATSRLRILNRAFYTDIRLQGKRSYTTQPKSSETLAPGSDQPIFSQSRSMGGGIFAGCLGSRGQRCSSHRATAAWLGCSASASRNTCCRSLSTCEL